MTLRMVRDASPREFLDAAGPLLYQREAVNSLMLGLAGEYLRHPGPDAIHGYRLLDAGQTVLAALQTPPKNLIISSPSGTEAEAGAGALRCLADFLRAEGAVFPGVLGPGRTAAAFAGIWAEQTSTTTRCTMRQGIYQLEAVRDIPMRGVMRLADPGETETIALWYVEYEVTIFGRRITDLPTWRRDVAGYIGDGGLYVLDVAGEMSALARVTGRTRNGIRVVGVYTPPARRGRGYASALVADLSRKMLAEGCRYCFLYTDLANPTSNAIYRRIGYEQVVESEEWSFFDT